jgi:hypothetical protein
VRKEEEMENLGILIFGGAFCVCVYVGYLVYKKHKCKKCGKFFCNCK